jgi:hypothetical protein
MLVEVPPYVLGLGLSLLYRSLFMGTSTWSGPWVFGLLLPHIVSFVFLIWLMRLARRQLSKEIAGAEPLSLQQLIADARSRLRAVIRTLRQWPPVQRSS